ncbi:hypothetical protein [Hansschlegelia quercus]|nr:hypothetical protein [Hansschlegelia quercus]
MKAEILNRMGDNLGAMRALETVPAASRKGSFFRVLRECVRSRGEIPLFEAIAAPSFVSKDLTLSTSMNNYSILLREMGDARAGIAVARERFMKARRAFKFGRLSKPVEKPGWVDEAKACLADLKAHFAQGGVSFFLISGVFLGAVRDQAIIGHDKDIDVGVDETVSVERIKELFRHSETFVIREIPSKRSVYLMHCSGVKVDVFIHYLENGRYWHEGPKVRWWNTPFELESIAFLGDTYLSPKNKDLYLVENYGDWRTPVSEFETFVDTPNMEITSGDHMIWYYLTKLTDYYLQGRKPQLQRVWNALTERYRADDALKRAVEQVMETDYDAARRQRESKTHTVNVRTPALVIGRLIKKLTIGGARNL